jgi:hypothetical protein
MSGTSVRSATSGVQASSVRPSPAPSHAAIATELAAAQAVTAAAGSDPVRQDLPRAVTQPDAHDIVLDAQSREVLFRNAEVRITRRTPDVAARRLKAYARPAGKRANEPQADFEV